MLKAGEVAEAMRQSKTVAEKVAGQAGGPPKPRPAQQSVRPVQQPVSRPVAQTSRQPHPAGEQNVRPATAAKDS